jgi:hypothetical protein
LLLQKQQITGRLKREEKEAPRSTKKGWPEPSFTPGEKTRNRYFFVFFGVFAAVFFALPHDPFDLQAISNLLFKDSCFKISQGEAAVNDERRRSAALQTLRPPVIIPL